MPPGWASHPAYLAGQLDLQGEVVAGVAAAQVGDVVLHDEPPVLLTRSCVPEVEVDDDPAVGRELLEAHEPAHVPHEEAGIELGWTQPAADPPGSPVPQRHDDRP